VATNPFKSWQQWIEDAERAFGAGDLEEAKAAAAIAEAHAMMAAAYNLQGIQQHMG
jgi:hypothetical protein